MAAKHEIRLAGERQWTDVTATTDYADPQSLGYDQYVEGTATEDKLRFRGSSNRMPFKVVFTDRANVTHRVTIYEKYGQFTTIFPVTGEIKWFGHEEDRTDLDAQAQVALVQFGYASSTMFQPSGIRVVVQGWKNSKMGEYASDTKRWQNAMKMAKTGTECVKNLAEAYAKPMEAGAKLIGALKPVPA